MLSAMLLDMDLISKLNYNNLKQFLGNVPIDNNFKKEEVQAATLLLVGGSDMPSIIALNQKTIEQLKTAKEKKADNSPRRLTFV
jgi:hypothetical protein